MNTKTLSAMAIVAACGLNQAASAQTVVNVSGATLMENLIKAPASTNDFLDVDGNGISGQLENGVQQLAPFSFPPSSSQHWVVMYRVVGSVNGVQELVDYGTAFATGGDGVEILSTDASEAYYNRTLYIDGGVSAGNGLFNIANAGGAPVRSFQNTLIATSVDTDPSTTGIRIDIAPTDVPPSYAAQGAAGVAGPFLNPGQAGYGRNPRLSVDTTGAPAGFDHLLADLRALSIYDPAQGFAGTQNQVYGTPLAWVPIAALTNFGTGIEQVTTTDLQYTTTTGRLPSGENITQVTRDSGSGTRNGFMNSIGIDPSWGIGENVGGVKSTDRDLDKLGLAHQPSHKGGSSRMEDTLANIRLGFGYTGAERGIGKWLDSGTLEVLAVQNDVQGGTEFSRPTIEDVVFNDVNGFIIGGPGTMATLGDPRSNTMPFGDAGNANAGMRNPQAAAYMNNLTRSVEAFTNVPGGDESLFMPGEFVATIFILNEALDNRQNQIDPLVLDANPVLNVNLQNFTLANNVLSSPFYDTFNSGAIAAGSPHGKVPTRLTSFDPAAGGNPITYTDGVADGLNYVDQAGNTIAYGSALAERNRIAGDFNGDGERDLNDIAEMVAAWNDRNGGPTWVAPAGTGSIAGAPGSDAIIEVLGDFDGDGNFNALDVRYFADGLAMDNGQLNRAEGFRLVDVAAGGDFFGTVLATGTYEDGDAKGDIANASGHVASGWAPVGADGFVDEHDVNYLCSNFGNWSDLSQAVSMDLSADMDGDLDVDGDDLNVMLTQILNTANGDVNLDGVVDAADESIVSGNVGMASPRWSDGDLNCDGAVDGDDLAFFNGGGQCACDWNGADNVNFFDLLDFLDDWFAGAADFNASGGTDFFDLLDFLDCWFAASAGACPSGV